jgi:hypothetical protein
MLRVADYLSMIQKKPFEPNWEYNARGFYLQKGG